MAENLLVFGIVVGSFILAFAASCILTVVIGGLYSELMDIELGDIAHYFIIYFHSASWLLIGYILYYYSHLPPVSLKP